MQAATATVMVPNPLRERVPQLRVIERELTYVEDRVRTARALRDDPLGQMHQRRQIGDAQYQAGRKFQSTWEAAGTPLRSSGNIIEHVDGGRTASDGITDKRIVAAKLLDAWRILLGRDGYHLVEAVLINKRTVRDVADTGAMMPGKAATTYYGHSFRRQLLELDKAMGFSA
jgi:hypothetical protein